MLNAVFLGYESLAPADMGDIQLLCELSELDFRDKTSPQKVNNRVQHADILFTNKVVIGNKMLRKS